MNLPRRMHIFAVCGAIALLAAGCSGGDDDEPSATETGTPSASAPAPTATPLTRVPDPILVTSEGVPSSGGTATEEEAEYTVISGDTLGAIAERFGVDAQVIRDANDLDGDNIFIGQVLTIPRGEGGEGGNGNNGGSDDGPGTGAEGEPEETSTPLTGGGENTYTVQAGDTAFGIALEFDTTVEALAAANGLTEDQMTDLQIGQVINLPSP